MGMKYLCALLLAVFSLKAFCGQVPVGYQIPDDSISPDHRFGVSVPMREGPAEETAKNSVIELQSGRTVAAINAYTGWDHANHDEPLPSRWSKDSSILVWSVDGKWFPNALVVLHLKDNALAWQLDLLKAAQTEILARTRQATPEKYAAIKVGHKGWGSAYKDGFSIDVEVDGEIALPLRFHATLTSDPKGADNLAVVQSHLEGVVAANGEVSFKEFGLGRGRSRRF